MSDIDTRNDFMVGAHGDDIVLLSPPSRMTKPQAVRLAAWLVALADYGNEHSFADVSAAVNNT